MCEVNPNEAPEGYEARAARSGSCTGCALLGNADACDDVHCLRSERNDGGDVILVKKLK